MELLDAGEEFVVVSLALGAADDFADVGEEDVHGADSLAVLVLLHVEGLDFLGVVCEDYGLLEVLLDEIALVLALEVRTPVYGELEFLAGLLENLHALGVGKADEVVMEHELEALDETLVEMLGKEFDVIAAVVECITDAVLYELLGEVHVVGNVVEGHLRLNHPEFGEVTRSVGVLGAEGRAEGVDFTEGRGAELAFKLTADR